MNFLSLFAVILLITKALLPVPRKASEAILEKIEGSKHI